jgi:L-ribulose-5-phosphate 3-epimerase
VKKGLSYWSFPDGLEGRMALVEAARLTHDAGYDGIELAVSANGELTDATTDSDVGAIGRSVRAVGVEIASLASGLAWNYPLTSADEAIRRKGIDHVKRGLQIARILGTDAFLVVPGAVDIFFNPAEPVVQYDVAMNRLRAALDELVPFAEHAGVAIALENVWNRFLLSPIEVRDLIDAYRSRYLGAYFDTGNVMLTGYPEHWIRILGSRIKRVHFKDFSRAVGTIHGFVDLLAGDVDWPAVMRALRETGYDGYCTAELIPAYQRAPEARWENASRAMDKIFNLGV